MGDPANPHHPIRHSGEEEKSLPIRQRKGRKLVRESDEAIVLRMGMEQNIPVGKGLC